jgi:hypothetical protein
MADDVGVRVEGLAALTRTMRKAGEDLGDLKEANARAAAIVIARAAAIAPRRSGRLAATLRSSKVAGRARIMAGRASVPYGPPIHWGWPARGIEAQPFISTAAQDTEPQWLPQYVADVQAALDHVRGA